MVVFPAINLSNGLCVSLHQGDWEKKTVINEDPLNQAKIYINAGAKGLHIVDLDGFLSGNLKNFAAVQDIRDYAQIPIHVGGALRSFAQINRYQDMGVDKVILGAKAVEDRYFLRKAYSIYGDFLGIFMEVKDDVVATKGWKNISEWDYLSFAKEINEIGLSTIIYADVTRDGTLSGPNFEHLEQLVRKVPSVRIIASGGVRSKDDLKDIKKLGVYGTIVSSSLHEGLLKIEEAISV